MAQKIKVKIAYVYQGMPVGIKDKQYYIVTKADKLKRQVHIGDYILGHLLYDDNLGEYYVEAIKFESNNS